MKYAWIQDGRIRDIAIADPTNIYHPDVAVFYDTQVPDDAKNGDFYADGVVTPAPVAVVEPVEPTRQWTDEDFRAGMTLAEKTKWDNNSAPEIITVKAELPKELEGATELLDFLVGAGVIAQASADKILA